MADYKPDPSAFIQMSKQGSDSLKVDDFVGGYDGSGRKKVDKPKKKTFGQSESTRVDDWVGGGGPTKRSWKVKSVSTSSIPKYDSDEDKKQDDEAAATTAVRRSSELPPRSPPASPEKQPVSPRKSTGSPQKAADDVYKPDPSEFKRMNDLHEAGSEKNQDYVGGTTAHTGRTKLEKKWQPKKPDEGERFGRVDDWVGASPTGARRSWKAKPSSTSSLPKYSDDDDHKHNDVPHASPTRRWKPPPKEDAIPPPWMGSPSSKPKSPSKWQPKSPSLTSPSKEASTPETSAKQAVEAIPAPPHASPPSSSPKKSDIEFYKPDPSEFKRMNDLHEAGAAKNEDYVGSTSGYTGRTKVEKKKWAPTKPESGDTSARVDEWAGGKTCTKAGYKIKSVSTKPPQDDGGAHVPYSSPTSPTKRWKPPPKEDAISPPWMASPSSKPQSPSKWKPKSPSKSPGATAAVPAPPHYDEPAKDSHDESETSAPAPAGNPLYMQGVTIHKPDASAYIQMRNIDEAGAARNDDYVGGTAGHTGRTKFDKKKWTPSRPEAGDTAARVDQWAGGKTCTKAGYKVKSVSTNKPPEDKEEEPESPAPAPTPAPKPSSPTPKEPEDEPEASAPAPAPAGNPSYMQGVTIHKPDASAYIQMRNIDEAGAARNDDYVGGTAGHTGRTKFDKKKWTPSRPDAGDNAARVDQWAGGKTCTKKGYKVKSISSVPPS